MTDEAGVLARDVTVTYRNGHTALRRAGFSVPEGSITALIGPNGAGKSTLFKALMGLVPVSGEVRLLGLPVAEALARSLVAYVPQAEEVDWTFPVLVEDVVMMGRYGRMGFLRRPRAADREAVNTALARVGMSDYRHRQIGELSGGQRKRVFLARALAQDGRLILLDEPFTGVDAGTEDRIIDLLGELRDEGRVILVSTHDLARVPEFCDRVVVVRGTVLASGPTEETFTPETLALAFGEPRAHRDRTDGSSADRSADRRSDAPEGAMREAPPGSAEASPGQAVHAAGGSGTPEAGARRPATHRAATLGTESAEAPDAGTQASDPNDNGRSPRSGAGQPAAGRQFTSQHAPSSPLVHSSGTQATRERAAGNPFTGSTLAGSGSGQ